jgi:hypothetical protein
VETRPETVSALGLSLRRRARARHVKRFSALGPHCPTLDWRWRIRRWRTTILEIHLATSEIRCIYRSISLEH